MVNTYLGIRTLFTSRSLYIKIIINTSHQFLTDLKFGTKSNLIHGTTENRLRHASGPVHAKYPIRYIHTYICECISFQIVKIVVM